MGRENDKDMHWNYRSSFYYYFLNQHYRMGSLFTNGIEFQLHGES